MDNTANNNNDNLEMMREAWRSQRFNTPPVPDRSSDTWRANRAGAFSQQLAARFRTFSVGCLLMSVLIWGFNCVLQLPLWLMICITAFFLIMGALKISMWLSLRGLDFGAMNLRQAVDRIVALRRAMILRVVVGMSLGLPLLVTMLYQFLSDEPGVFAGGVAGAVAGAIIGWAICRRNLWFIRKMRQTFADTENEPSGD